MRRRVQWWCRLACVGAALAAARAADAHVPQLRGRLIDLVGQSDLVVVGTVERVTAADPHAYLVQLQEVEALLGTTDQTSLTMRARLRFAPHQRFVFFIRRTGDGLECVQPSGNLFPARPADDAGYREAIAAIRRALPLPANERVAALRAAVIPALTASAPYLRYQALLELGALAHDGMSAAERHTLEQLAADPKTDPAVRQVLATLLRASADEPLVGTDSKPTSAE